MDLDVRLAETTQEFTNFLETWHTQLTTVPLEQIIQEAKGPEQVGIFCVDVINGFCYEGPLHSDRIAAIVPPIVRLFQKAYDMGVRNFVLTYDAHDPAAVEFNDYPPHCIRGTSESAIVPELMQLPCTSYYHLIPKNSISSAIRTGLDDWLDTHPQITHRIVVGDCTDLCTYQLAMHLKLRANAVNRLDPVIVPSNCVQTYDIPVEVAKKEQIPAHPADLLHLIFLYNMATNGVQVVSEIT